MMAGKERGLVLCDISKRYGGREAVSGLSFSLRPGQILSLMGPNGAGKTTTYRMLIGAERPDSGRIHIDGLDVTGLPSYGRARCGLSYLPQALSAFRGLSVADNIRLALENTQTDRAHQSARLHQLLGEMDLHAVAHQKPGQLSGGQLRRCEIARLLATNPRYVLLDEPFAGLDLLAIGLVQTLIKGLAAKGIGILITDHNIRETLAISDRVLVIAGGYLRADAAPDAILADPSLRGLWLGPDFVA
jgi:lipopolysaccharide export system ATP-binding protein